MNETVSMWKKTGFTFEFDTLTVSNIILPSLGVIIVCISTYLLAGLIVVFISFVNVFLQQS